MLRKALHIILSGLILSSSAGVVVQKHFCFNDLVSAALFSEPVKCHDSGEKGAIPLPISTDGVHKKDCCDDTVDFVKTNQEESLSGYKLLVLTNAIPHNPLTASFDFSIDKPSNFERYKPPLLFCDLSVRFQNLLC